MHPEIKKEKNINEYELNTIAMNVNKNEKQ